MADPNLPPTTVCIWPEGDGRLVQAIISASDPMRTVAFSGIILVYGILDISRVTNK